ncbi:OmpA family protein [Brevundimonas sp. 2R-24]|uniref:OmpA family protein n=1 Tax=Peiella sedimenti TaxID=3061083 RepID=A0ABT8SP42_9CAUL|nr:OmpA family protein [Caulobacteraceae bacterium XZ-24]
MKWAVLLGVALAVGGCAETRRILSRADLVREPMACADRVVPVYFADSQAALTPPARQALLTAARELKACPVTAVEIIGLASARGGPEANLRLSEARGAQVAQLLTREGLPQAQVMAAGEAGSVNPDGTEEPVRRRAEVLLRVARPA